MVYYDQENDFAPDYRPSNPTGSVEPIRKPDHKAKRHGRPSKWHRLKETCRATVELTVIAIFVGSIRLLGMGVGV